MLYPCGHHHRCFLCTWLRWVVVCLWLTGICLLNDRGKLRMQEQSHAAETDEHNDGDNEIISKPVFVLHVGLPKTGTTFLKNVLCGHQREDDVASDAYSTRSILLRDDFAALGILWANGGGKDRNKDCIVYEGGNLMAKKKAEDGTEQLDPNFVNGANKMLQLGRNVIFVFEPFWSNTPEQIRAIADFLTPNWNVQVLIGYRPLYSWLPSLHNEVQRKYRWAWPGQRGSETEQPWPERSPPPQAPFLRNLAFDLEDDRPLSSALFRFIEERGQHPAELVRERYGKAFGADHVSILPLHLFPAKWGKAGDPLLGYIFCRALLKWTPNTCFAVEGGKLATQGAFSNPSSITDYYLLADRAYELELVPKDSLRRIVTEAIAKHDQQQVRHSSGSSNNEPPSLLLSNGLDGARKCMSNATLDRLERVSWDLEQRLFNNYTWHKRNRPLWSTIKQARVALGDVAVGGTKEDLTTVTTPVVQERMQAIHHEGFRDAVSRNTYCRLDVDQVFEDKSSPWVRFFEDSFSKTSNMLL